MRYTICYVSTATAKLDKEKVSSLLKKIEESNNKNDVKGILLYSDGNFFHVMEGEKQYILELFSEIKSDRRHTNIIQIVGKEMETTAFDGFVTDIVTDENKYDSKTFQEYLEPLEGMDPKTKEVAKRMLEVFIETSN
ncbi:BLUF domain-containing protein [Antarcticibacterium flavum]|uniref:BLUF domain-containing protein n=1 Tax=Antarcticibacterium flavum TaxID=2058175 RepID=A0A5B7X070_9FLAO|nr:MULTISPECIES: BLUF domain-containing protein [Antarcticibacterium]MCM4160941.1 blue light sensor protein [Antarcticibacterium sp. W02-3]QCY68984.1 BLUF domain-containing protein [Antarcticibacterium flavum]